MTLGKQQNNEEIIPPVIQEVEEGEEEEDALEEIAAQKNRQRFAINKSYSIEVVSTNKPNDSFFKHFSIYRMDSHEKVIFS